MIINVSESMIKNPVNILMFFILALQWVIHNLCYKDILHMVEQKVCFEYDVKGLQ